ncbi:glycoside hydrolase family 1 protein [Helcococcus ovis]|uniref:Glycoside hydrolase family 1 protein n=1 Tax=Helcococcus ovis TaxID=72026 RepID=A0A4R9C115_9FIRM|nr:glycoside hydrolase family 1 protein [Helcococcus ovis]TFF64106.1 glycoside hydrolase family 1 protein [Helcococcus ovis]TFF64858.1 glycoside hydrolase family 1 protein [Helcococcus ovis]TFF67549.1 glycoside hydrolase family 1 protein [Helcococcus ovis]WNZ00786.1 glycoside hydrolase family 1 protein [Helcococcus ovis]
MIKFPEGFYFGSATSATQSEGRVEGDGKGDNIWDLWFEKESYKFHNQIGPSKTSSFYENYKEDIKLLKATGQNSFRTSISWSRLFPKGYGEINQKSVEFYKDVFKRIKDEGLTLFINLYHFDMPVELQNIGGWENRDVVEHYANFAKTAFELFGEYVDRWFTFNEPIVHVECGYLLQYHYPLEVSPEKAILVGFHTQLASARAIEEFKKLNLTSKIGIVLNLTPAIPRSQHPKDLEAAKYAEMFAIRSFLDPSIKGTFQPELIDLLRQYNLLPTVDKQDLKIIKNNTIDFLGVNYYQPLRVKAVQYEIKKDAIFFPTNFYEPYEMPGRRINPHRGWEIDPSVVYNIAMYIKDNYNNIEWIMSENGMGVEGEEKFKVNGQIQDDYRIEFIKEHLTYLHKAIEEGANCIGYHVWTFIDCWSWLNSYKNRYGLVELNLETGERTIKKSGHWYKKLVENNGF